MKVFFSGYGWWFYKHRINGGMYSIFITDLGTPMLFPLHDRAVALSYDTNTLIRTTGTFYLECEDKYAYVHAKITTHIKKLYPCNEYSIEDSFPRITEGLLIGMKPVIAEDCFFVIDNDQNPEFTFPDDNKNKRDDVNDKHSSLSDNQLEKLDSLKKFILQFGAARKKEDLEFDSKYMKCNEEDLLIALKKWAKKRDKKNQKLWDINKLNNLDIWPLKQRKDICELLPRGYQKQREENYFKIVGF